MAKKTAEDLREEFPSNSKSSRVAPIRSRRKEERTVEEVENRPARRKPAKAKGLVKKKTLTQSIAQSFIGEDARGVVSYILYEVLIPAAKNTIQEMVGSGIEMLLFGEAGGRSRSRGRDKERTIVSYGNFYKNKDREDDRRSPRRAVARDRFNLNEIYFRRGDEADEVLDELCNLLEEYGQVTVADYFDLADIQGATWAHNKWGWEDLRKAYCTHTRNGYAIVLPDPVELD